MARVPGEHLGRVFTRAHLLQEVWGYDYFGGTRTVDVHVRRLRAKLGVEHETLTGTVRNVGYRFVPAKSSEEGRAPHGLRPPQDDAADMDGQRGGQRCAGRAMTTRRPATTRSRSSAASRISEPRTAEVLRAGRRGNRPGQRQPAL